MDVPGRIDTQGLLQRYDVFLLDAYGVLINQEGPLPVK